jgi:lipoprotein-releasing system permease protein
MNLPFRFALRYVFSKKSTNAINLISMISVFGIALGSMSLIIILSVFNGFEDLLRGLMGVFKPDILVVAKEGKVFTIEDDQLLRIGKIDGVLSISKALEEIALFEHDGIQNIGNIKGVDENFLSVIRLDSTIEKGKFATYNSSKNVQLGVVGATIEHTLQIRGVMSKPISVYMPKRTQQKISLSQKPFEQRELYPAGTYSVRQVDYDNTVITNIKFVQDLMAYKSGEISSLEIKTELGKNTHEIQRQIKEILGAKLQVKNRFEQDEAFFKITNLEKWVGFLIFAFTLVLVAFNMIGALWMLVLEKKKDIANLKAMGATDRLVRNIFLAEGTLLSCFGVIIGTVTAVLVCFLQQQYGFVPLEGAGNSFLIKAYPVSMRIQDIILVIFTVLLIGLGASLLPALRAAQIKSLVREE